MLARGGRTVKTTGPLTAYAAVLLSCSWRYAQAVYEPGSDARSSPDGVPLAGWFVFQKTVRAFPVSAWNVAAQPSGPLGLTVRKTSGVGFEVAAQVAVSANGMSSVASG